MQARPSSLSPTYPDDADSSRALSHRDSDKRLHNVLKDLNHLNVTECIELVGQIASAGGGYCDVYVGFALRGGSRIKVAIRQLRAFIIFKRDFKKVCSQLPVRRVT